MDPLDLLIEDGWIEVLKRVKNPEDLKSCSETCLLFQEILKKSKNEFMFSLILPHILRYLRDRKDRVQWKALLKCRLVCRSWCKSVNKLPEADNSQLFPATYQFHPAKLLEQFLQKFANHGGNPFLGRKVLFFLISPLLLAGNQAEGANEGADPAETYVRNLRQLLERFGREIWNVRLYDLGNVDPLVCCKNLQTALSHMSNLRVLQIYCSVSLFELSQEEQTQLTTYIAANPFTDLPQLEQLEATKIDVILSRSLLEKFAPQLTSLVVGNPSGFPEQASRFCKLEKLKLDCLNAGTSLQFLRQLSSPLRSLTLLVNHMTRVVDDVPVWPINELFRNIQYLPVQELDITIRDTFLGESGPIAAEDRPHHGSISSVSLCFQSGSASLNFLLYCPKLESVFMAPEHPRQGIPAGHPDGVAESLDVNELLEQVGYDLYLSNIWESVPSLKCFTLWNNSGADDPNRGENKYERVEYERRKLENGGEGNNNN